MLKFYLNAIAGMMKKMPLFVKLIHESFDLILKENILIVTMIDHKAVQARLDE